MLTLPETAGGAPVVSRPKEEDASRRLVRTSTPTATPPEGSERDFRVVIRTPSIQVAGKGTGESSGSNPLTERVSSSSFRDQAFSIGTSCDFWKRRWAR